MLEIKHLGKTYGTGEKATQAIGDVSFDGRGPRVRLRRRPVRLRQDDAAQVHRAACCAPTGGEVLLRGKRVTGPPRGDGARLPGVRPLADAVDVGAQQRRCCRCATRSSARRERTRARRGGARGGRADALHRPLPVAALGRHAAARRDRARARLPAVDPADGRAVRVGRRADARRPRGPRAAACASEFGVTILFVTHDIDESVYLSDRIVVLTHAPTEVKEIIAVDLPRPRDQIATKELPEFAHLRAHVYRLIKREQTTGGAEDSTRDSGALELAATVLVAAGVTGMTIRRAEAAAGAARAGQDRPHPDRRRRAALPRASSRASSRRGTS